MTLPNFLVIGAMKAGTTSLYNYLRAHPQVFMPAEKAPRFFTAEHNWDRGVGWYEGFFEPAEDAIARGEASVTYSAFPNFRDVPCRISQTLPDVRFVYLVREPVDRMISHLWMDVRQGDLERPASVAAVERDLLTKPRFVNGSRYRLQVEQYLEFFPRDRLLLVKSEDLRSDREPTLRRVFEFLGVDPDVSVDVGHEWNAGKEDRRKRRAEGKLRRIPGYGLLAEASPEPLRRLKRDLMKQRIPRRPVVSGETRHELEDRVRDDVRRLYEFMGPAFDGWGIA